MQCVQVGRERQLQALQNMQCVYLRAKLCDPSMHGQCYQLEVPHLPVRPAPLTGTICLPSVRPHTSQTVLQRSLKAQVLVPTVLQKFLQHVDTGPVA